MSPCSCISNFMTQLIIKCLRERASKSFQNPRDDFYRKYFLLIRYSNRQFIFAHFSSYNIVSRVIFVSGSIVLVS